MYINLAKIVLDSPVPNVFTHVNLPETGEQANSWTLSPNLSLSLQRSAPESAPCSFLCFQSPAASLRHLIPGLCSTLSVTSFEPHRAVTYPPFSVEIVPSLPTVAGTPFSSLSFTSFTPMLLRKHEQPVDCPIYLPFSFETCSELSILGPQLRVSLG